MIAPTLPPAPRSSAVVDPRIGSLGPALLALEDGSPEADLNRLVSPWHTDLDLGRPIEVMTDMANSRRLGFAAWQSTEDSFFDLFSELRARALIP